MNPTIELTQSQKLLYALIQRLGFVDQKVKLAKLQYFSDFIHFAFHDKPISEENNLYQRRKFGPLSTTFNTDLARLVDLGLIENKKTFQYKPAKDIEVALNETEARTIDYVVNKYASYSYDALADISHKQIPYISSVEGGVVDYTTAYNLVDEYPDYES